MNYPDDFDTPAFPAGKTIAFSRRVSFWIAVVVFFIVIACGMLLLLNKSKHNYPFLVSTDPITGDWSVIAYLQDNPTMTADKIIQEKLVSNYVDYWFSINSNNLINDAVWKRCDDAACNAPEQFVPGNYECALFCTSDSDLFDKFSEKILPEYINRISLANETIRVVRRTLTPPRHSSDKGGLWQAYIVLESSVNKRFEVLAFIDIARESETHPATLGYYVKDFNSYRMVVEQ